MKGPVIHSRPDCERAIVDDLLNGLGKYVALNRRDVTCPVCGPAPLTLERVARMYRVPVRMLRLEPLAHREMRIAYGRRRRARRRRN